MEHPVTRHDVDREPTSAAERERELVMEREAPDLPWGRRRHEPFFTGRGWFVLIVGLALALSLPLMYLALGLLGIFIASETGLIVVALAMIAALTLAMAGVSVYMRRRRAFLEGGTRRDDVGNRIVEKQQNKETHQMRRIQEVMNKDPVVCGTLDSMVDVARDMYKLNVGFLIVQNEKFECVGIVTDRDIVCAGLAQDLDPHQTPVTLVMEQNFVSIRPEDTLQRCLEVMGQNGIRRVPVLDAARKCVGVLSVDDLIARRLVSVDEIAPIFLRQIAEPNAQHGLSEDAKKDNRAA